MYPYYKKSPYDVNEDFARIRRDRNGAYSTDEDEDADGDEEENIFAKKEEVGESGHFFKKKDNGDISIRNNLEIDDSDNDDDEFDDAKEEE